MTDPVPPVFLATVVEAVIRAGDAPELVWLLEHPPLFTAGTSAAKEELINPLHFPVHEAGRGGRYTYHGPGQRVGYLMLDLDRRGRDVRCFVHALESWLIASLADLGVIARREPGRIGLWVGSGVGEAKIAAIGYSTADGRLIDSTGPQFGYSHEDEEVWLFFFTWRSSDLPREKTDSLLDLE